jgi:hypothetical protein
MTTQPAPLVVTGPPAELAALIEELRRLRSAA